MAFDKWVAVSHLRFGPSEVDDRAFSLAFWPDPRGSTPKALAGLFQDKDQAVFSIEDFQSVSIAAKGFYALEFLLFDPQFTQHENQAYHCAFVKAVANDILTHANTLRDDWHSGFADMMRNPTATSVFRNEAEVLQEMFKSLATGLQFTAESRLGRPLGTFDRPRPNRAEARRSGRSSRHVLLSLLALQDLAGRLAEGNPERSRKPEAVAFARRPGTFAVVIDCMTGGNLAVLNSPAGRHFYGHGTFSSDGSLLFTTENDYETGIGRIGVWDARQGYRRIDEWDSGGVGPHDIKRLPGTETLVVANGGIDMHPVSGHTKLNIPTMRPNLAYIQGGAVIEFATLPSELHKNSIRHLAVTAAGEVAFGMRGRGTVRS